jgi:two-component system response regulator YesN
MYRVLLVDDEPLTFIGMRNVFNWREAGFEIIAQTTNPYEALDIITAQRPDVVFADVRMPEISGLELIGRVREMGLDTEFVIVSGFAEFSYAQEALRHGAFDYCLKPVKVDAENLLLKRLATHLQNKKMYKDYGIFEKLMEEKTTISQYLEFAGVQSTCRYFQVVVAVYETPRDFKEPALPDEKLFLRLSSRKYLYLVNTEDALDRSVLSSFSSCRCSAGISRMAGSDAYLPDLYRQADLAVCNEFIYGQKGVYCYKPKNTPFVGKLAAKLAGEIENNGIQELKADLEGLPEVFRQNGLSIEDAVYLWNRLAAFAAEHAEDKGIGIDSGFMDYDEWMERMESFDAFPAALYELVAPLISAEEGKGGYSNENFLKLIEYVDAHYTERLFLKTLAADFYINLNYCCELFKKIKGCTFSDYVTGLRMKKAAELLKGGGLTIAEVANASGYEDYFYFNRVFSKYYGLSPAKYMRGRQGNG